jgi:hypothetical protein
MHKGRKMESKEPGPRQRVQALSFSSFHWNEKGAALAIALMMLVILAILGTAAIMTSTNEMDIAGNEKQYQVAFYAAEGGTEMTHRIIEDTLDLGTVKDYGNEITFHSTFLDDLMQYEGSDNSTDSPSNNPDITIVMPVIDPDSGEQVAQTTVKVDVDGTSGYLPGAGIQYAAGYDGIGAGAGGGGVAKYFTVDTQSIGVRNSSASIRTYYQSVIGITGGGG